MLKSPAFSTSFLESRMIQKLKSRKSRIKPGLFAFLLAGRIIFGKKTQKSQVSLLRYLTFSLVCGRIWQRGAPAGPPAVRVVGRWSPVATVQRRPRRQPRPSPSAPATKPAKTQCFRRFSFFMCCMVLVFIWVRTPGFLTRFYPFPTVLIPSSTRNAPSFAFFGLFRVRFRIFCCFAGAKFTGLFLYILPHSAHRLKPSVIPCKREVSFLT